MLRDFLILLSAPIAQTAMCLTHVFCTHSRLVKSPILAMGVGFLVGGFAFGVIWISFLVQGSLLLSDWFAGIVLNGIGYIAFSAGYFNFVNLNIASLRIRVLRELREAETGSLERRVLYANYNESEILDSRLDRMLKANILVSENGRYFLGNNHIFYILARFVWFLKRVITAVPPWYERPGKSPKSPSL